MFDLWRDMYRGATPVLRILIWLAIGNFALFVIISIVLGGDALNGTAVYGHYYLASHGRQTEVSRGVFVYSKVHALSLFVTHPLGIVAIAIARLRANSGG